MAVAMHRAAMRAPRGWHAGSRARRGGPAGARGAPCGGRPAAARRAAGGAGAAVRAGLRGARGRPAARREGRAGPARVPWGHALASGAKRQRRQRRRMASAAGRACAAPARLRASAAAAVSVLLLSGPVWSAGCRARVSRAPASGPVAAPALAVAARRGPFQWRLRIRRGHAAPSRLGRGRCRQGGGVGAGERLQASVSLDPLNGQGALCRGWEKAQGLYFIF